MKIFGYRNVKMFFIPLFGAAVSGRHYQVDGWKKAIVSLAGPLPSIVLGLIIGGIGVYQDSPLMIKACTLTLIINALNLLPFLPLDGGWVAHITLFSRSRIVDLIFRIATILILAGFWFLTGDVFLIVISIIMLIGLPFIWKTMQATEAARQRELPAPSKDEIPAEAIRQIAGVVQQVHLPMQDPKQLAGVTVNVYEAVSSRPPSWPATIGIWSLHVGGFLLALVGGIALLAADRFQDRFGDYAAPDYTQHELTVDTTDNQLEAGTSELPEKDLLIWQFSDKELASASFQQLSEDNSHTVARFGSLVLASRPTVDESGDDAMDDGEFDDRSYAEIIQSEESNRRFDKRLPGAPPATWQRSFGEQTDYPRIMVTFDDVDKAESLMEAINNRPYIMGKHHSIPPRVPGHRLTDEQQSLQSLLATLLGASEQTPWLKTESEADYMPGESGMPDARQRQKLLRDMQRHSRVIAKRRTKWIEKQRDAATDTRRELLDAYLEFTQAQKEWKAKRKQSDDAEVRKLPPPDLAKYLAPLLERLGYVANDAPLFRYASGSHAILESDDQEEESEPLDTDSPDTDSPDTDSPDTDSSAGIMAIHLNDCADAAAVFAATLNWVSDFEPQQITLNYHQVVLPDDERAEVEQTED